MAEERKQILLVEDDDDIRDGLRELLEEEGYLVAVARHGEEALAVLEDHRPACILLDLMMPVMDGYEFLAAVRCREGEPHARIPVVVLTATPKGAARPADVATVIEKPIDVPALLDALLTATAVKSG